ncbi:hypothetical protein G4228_020286 [Cervus hanglu yarkandensis]|uniref:Uncharacterized protein n=1 Tax=Cervus hanglu yarkandensis TaxID=84702 RepID=A0A833SR61_9CERV|nr:hypothetical protein G4228_020286 [Cervus hanglu yarkandensis]
MITATTAEEISGLKDLKEAAVVQNLISLPGETVLFLLLVALLLFPTGEADSKSTSAYCQLLKGKNCVSQIPGPCY